MALHFRSSGRDTLFTFHQYYLYYHHDYNEDAEILSVGIVKAYGPPSMEAAGSSSNNADATSNPSSQLQDMYAKEARIEDGMDLVEQEQKQPAGINLAAPAVDDLAAYAAEA